ncbi:MAG: tetratricopeptide repeat protein [Promethearchaeota archaeon]
MDALKYVATLKESFNNLLNNKFETTYKYFEELNEYHNRDFLIKSCSLDLFYLSKLYKFAQMYEQNFYKLFDFDENIKFYQNIKNDLNKNDKDFIIGLINYIMFKKQQYNDIEGPYIRKENPPPEYRIPLKNLSRIYKLNPNNPFINLWYFETSLVSHQGFIHNTIKKFKNLIDDYPDSVWLHYRVMMILFDLLTHKYRQIVNGILHANAAGLILQIINKIKKIIPNCSQIYYVNAVLISLAYRNRPTTTNIIRDYRIIKGLNILKKAIKINPYSDIYLVALVEYFPNNITLVEKKVILDNAKKINSKNDKVFWLLAKYSEDKNIKISYLKLAISLNPKIVDYWYDLGIALFTNSDYENALIIFDKIQKFPISSTSYLLKEIRKLRKKCIKKIKKKERKQRK